jgi:hypothetical protein
MDDLFSGDVPRLWEEALKRAHIPHWYMPDVVGGIVAGKDLLLRAGYRPGSCRPQGWSPSLPGAFKRRHREPILFVAQLDHKNLWLIERSVRGVTDEALVLMPGPLLVFTRTYQAAMRLAEFCCLGPRPEAPGLHWIDTNAAN